MAVYVRLEADDLRAVREAFGLLPIREARGIAAGSINTNYLLETDGGRLFLRHTTARDEADLGFEAALLAHLAEAHFPAPHLLPTLDGRPFLPLRGGRVSLFRYLAGEELTRRQLTEAHLERLGAELGKLHRLGGSFGGERQNPYGPALIGQWVEALAADPDPEVSAAALELRGYLRRAEEGMGGLVPTGPIHADLFMDNVKWLGSRVSALFDFEMACCDAFVLDLAITLNAWCFEGGYRGELCRALLRGYQGERALSPAERQGLWAHALFGAVRYTASRIRDFHLSTLEADRLVRKDYRTYLARARTLAATTPTAFWDEVWGQGA